MVKMALRNSVTIVEPDRTSNHRFSVSLDARYFDVFKFASSIRNGKNGTHGSCNFELDRAWNR